MCERESNDHILIITMKHKIMTRTFSITTLLLCFSMFVCSCESKREQEAIKICQETKMQLDPGFVSQFGDDDNVLSQLLIKAGFSIYGLDYENSTWMDFANMVAEKSPNEKFHWMAKSTDTKNVYQVGFLNEEDWGHFWEVNIREKTVMHINQKEYKAREYGHSRLDKDAPFKIKDLTSDTLKLSNEGVSYKIQGKVVNHTGKSISYADMDCSLKVIFENKTEEVSNSYSKNHKVLKKEVSESHPWKDGEAIDFTVITREVKQIYLDYDPQYVYFTIEMSAGDPIGYSYNKAIYEVDMKDRWNAIRKK